MPITKQAIKRVRQDKTKTARNKHYGNHMKSMMKLILEYARKGETDKANKILPKVISSIDTAAKKNIIHKHNASRKKSLVQRALAKPAEKKAEKAPKKEEKAEKKEKKVSKKEEKVEDVVEEKVEEVVDEKGEKKGE